MGTTQRFAVLGGSTVTNTGPTVITGDLGLSPGTAVPGFPPGLVVGGAIHAADAVALQGQNDLVTAFNGLSQPCTANLTGQDLGGKTLTAGVYCFPSTSAQLTGTLTLDAQGDPAAVFIFEIGSTLTTASTSTVRVINGGNNCNAFWQVGSSATLGTGTTFVGNILALTSIALNTGTRVSGRALARNGAVTLDTNTVGFGACATNAPVSTSTPTATASPVPSTPTATLAPTSTPVPPTSTPVPSAPTSTPVGGASSGGGGGSSGSAPTATPKPAPTSVSPPAAPAAAPAAPAAAPAAPAAAPAAPAAAPAAPAAAPAAPAAPAAAPAAPAAAEAAPAAPAAAEAAPAAPAAAEAAPAAAEAAPAAPAAAEAAPAAPAAEAAGPSMPMAPEVGSDTIQRLLPQAETPLAEQPAQPAPPVQLPARLPATGDPFGRAMVWLMWAGTGAVALGLSLKRRG